MDEVPEAAMVFIPFGEELLVVLGGLKFVSQ